MKTFLICCVTAALLFLSSAVQAEETLPAGVLNQEPPPSVEIGPTAIETHDAHGQPCCKAPSWTPKNYCSPCYRGRIVKRVVYRFRSRRCCY